MDQQQLSLRRLRLASSFPAGNVFRSRSNMKKDVWLAFIIKMKVSTYAESINMRKGNKHVFRQGFFNENLQVTWHLYGA